MHEVSLMQSTLELAVEQAQRQGATQIHQITLRIGQLSGVDPDAIAFAFDVVTQNTMAEKAQLHIDFLPAICYCAHCQQTFQPSDWVDECPTCHHLSMDLRQGKELQLASMEVS